MSDLLARGERIKLARALGIDPVAVEYLAPLSVPELRALRRAAQNVLFGRHESLFRRAAAPARILPAALMALIARKVFGPVLSSRVSGLMPPAKAVDIASHLSAEFQADISIAMDPRRAQALIRAMPVDIVVLVARELVRRREFIVMAQFVDDLSDAAIRAVTERVVDDNALLQVAFYVEDAPRLDELTAMLPDARLRGVVTLIAKGSPEMQAAGLAMMSQLGPRQQGRLGDIAIGLGAELLTAVMVNAARQQASDVVRAVITNASAAGRAAFVELIGHMDAAALALWSEATTAAGMWPVALEILAGSGAALQAQTADALRRLGPDVLRRVGADARQAIAQAGGDLAARLGPLREFFA